MKTRLKCHWYSPSDGSAIYIGTFRPGSFTKSFDPPGAEARGNDWVLVIDDSSKRYPVPGKINQQE
jgi:hypothetical protein